MRVEKEPLILIRSVNGDCGVLLNQMFVYLSQKMVDYFTIFWLIFCILGKLTTKQLGMLDLCYAPPFARTWDVLNVAGNVSK